MVLNVHELSVGAFTRGLTNLQTMLVKAETYVRTNHTGEAAFLSSSLAGLVAENASRSTNDLHAYSLAAHIHWAAEGARLAVGRLLGTAAEPVPLDAISFADLNQWLVGTIAHLRQVASEDLEAGCDQVIVIEHRRGSTSSPGAQFLNSFALPHFYYHVTAAYSIMRNQGVPLTMGDFLGNWGTR